MNPEIQQQAKRADLAQRLMLQSLTASLQTYESQLSALEHRAAKQSITLEEIRTKLDEIYAARGLNRPASHDARKPKRTGPAFQIVPGIRRALGNVLPQPSGDWDSFMGQLDQYLVEQGVDTVLAPLLQLLPSGLGAPVCKDYQRSSCAAPWDKLDYGIVGVSVLVAVLLDFFLVATPNGSFMGETQRQSPISRWLKEQSTNLAPHTGKTANLSRNAFQQWVAKLTTEAEKRAEIPYDLVIPKEGLTPNVHRLAPLGDDPILGLIFGVLDIMSGSCTFVSRDGAWSVIAKIPGHAPTANVIEAILKVIVHGLFGCIHSKRHSASFHGTFSAVGQ